MLTVSISLHCTWNKVCSCTKCAQSPLGTREQLRGSLWGAGSQSGEQHLHYLCTRVWKGICPGLCPTAHPGSVGGAGLMALGWGFHWLGSPSLHPTQAWSCPKVLLSHKDWGKEENQIKAAEASAWQKFQRLPYSKGKLHYPPQEPVVSIGPTP